MRFGAASYDTAAAVCRHPGGSCSSRRRSGVFGRSDRPPAGPAGARGSAARPRRAARRATLAWSPEVSTSGMARPSNTCGRVYCGYSSRPCAKLSSAPEASLPMTPGKQPHAGVEQRHGGDLAARQHVIADRDLLEAAGLDHPLVHALEAAADDDRARALRQRRAPAPASAARRAGSSAGAGAVVGRDAASMRARQHVGAHHHAGAAAGRRVVDRAVLVGARARGCRSPRATRAPAASALPARLTPSGPGNISGKMVRTVARHMAQPVILVLRRCRSGCSSPAGGIDHDPLAGDDRPPARPLR